MDFELSEFDPKLVLFTLNEVYLISKFVKKSCAYFC